MTKKVKDVDEFAKCVDDLFNGILKDLEELSENNKEYSTPEMYKEKTGKRFRMTKEQKTRGMSRKEAFEEFINL
tara:strand:- start:748 stop:969 length:222 start_codon:yes stop_codon:yes gene_type:complete